MFAPRVVRAQKKAPTAPSNKVARQHSLLPTAEVTHALGREPSSLHTPAFDFSRLPVFGPDHQAKSSLQHRNHPPPFTVRAPELYSAVGTGEPLPSPLLGELSAQTGADLSAVRVHADARGDHLARVLGAEAVAFGTEIAVRANRFRPSTPTGRQGWASHFRHPHS